MNNIHFTVHNMYSLTVYDMYSLTAYNMYSVLQRYSVLAINLVLFHLRIRIGHFKLKLNSVFINLQRKVFGNKPYFSQSSESRYVNMVNTLPLRRVKPNIRCFYLIYPLFI